MAIALRLEGAERLAAMLRGLRLYQASPNCRDLPDPPVIWRGGAARLLDYGEGDASRVVLVAPSLINRHHILDLDHDVSLMRGLAKAGLRPLLLDWGIRGRRNSGSGFRIMSKSG